MSNQKKLNGTVIVHTDVMRDVRCAIDIKHLLNRKKKYL